MDPATKQWLLQKGGQVLGSLVKIAVTRPSQTKPTGEAKEEVTVSTASFTRPVAQLAPAPSFALPTSEETTTELKRRLSKELYRAELDLAAGLKIAGRPCDCLENKHTLMLEAASEELISQDPGNSAYQDIIDWVNQNRSKVSVEAIHSGQYAAEYPHMASEFKGFRKRVMGSVGETPAPDITLEQAKKLAAEEAVKEVEKAWVYQEKR